MRTLRLTVDPHAPDQQTLERAARLLAAGELVAFPTETVYGLGADARNPAAVAAIFAAKGRPADNPLIVHIAATEQLAALGRSVSPLTRRLAERFWPGPLTLIVEAAAGLAPQVSAGLDTVAVRAPDHPVALALLRAFGGPVAAPSANRSGRPSPTRAADVLADLDGRIAAVLDGGPATVGVESTVVDARGPLVRVLREGGVTRELLAAALGAALAPPAPEGVTAEDDEPARSPGMRHRHYAPGCRVVLVGPEDWPRALAEAAGAAVEARAASGERHDRNAIAVIGRTLPPALPVLCYVERIDGSVPDYARRLFGAMLDAERAGADLLLIETVAEEGIGRAVMDRLRRAAAAHGQRP